MAYPGQGSGRFWLKWAPRLVGRGAFTYCYVTPTTLQPGAGLRLIPTAQTLPSGSVAESRSTAPQADSAQTPRNDRNLNNAVRSQVDYTVIGVADPRADFILKLDLIAFVDSQAVVTI